MNASVKRALLIHGFSFSKSPCGYKRQGRGLCQKHQSVAVAKMASHAIFQYNVLAIDDTHNTWINVIVKMTILRLLGSSDDKEKRGVVSPEGPPLRGDKD